MARLLRPHREGQNNTGFLPGNTDKTENTTLFLHVNHICNAELAVFSNTTGQTELQLSPRVAERREISLPHYGHPPEHQSKKLQNFVMHPKPTFDCRVVGFDVFKQPVPIDLVAEVEHQKLHSLTLSPWLITAIIGSSFPLQPQTIQRTILLLVVLLCLQLWWHTFNKKNQNIWRDDAELAKWKQGFLSVFLPVARRQGLFGERSVTAVLKQKRPGNPYKWTCVRCRLAAAVVVTGKNVQQQKREWAFWLTI